jgi:hypothetical protein
MAKNKAQQVPPSQNQAEQNPPEQQIQQQNPQSDKPTDKNQKSWVATVDCVYNGRRVKQGEIVYADGKPNSHFEAVK